MLENIKILIKGKDVCVLSTVSKDAVPHSSFMAYITGENRREIYMTTHSTSNKYKNMQKNPAVNLLIDYRVIKPRQKAHALTICVVFQPINDEHKRSRIESLLIKQHAHLKDFINDPAKVSAALRRLNFPVGSKTWGCRYC